MVLSPALRRVAPLRRARPFAGPCTGPRAGRLTALLACVVLAATACSPAGPAMVEADDVDGARSSFVVDGTQYGAEAFAWRDESPSVVDDEQPGPCAILCAAALVVDLAGGTVPDDFRVTDLVAIVDGDEQRFAEVEARGTGAALRPEAFEIVGRGGPGVEPGDSLDVLLRITLPDGTRTLLRVRDVVVERTG